MAAAGLSWRWTASVVVACAGALGVAAACGGEAERLSHADFVRRADAICERADRESRKLDDADVSLPELLRRTDELAKRTTEDLRSLRPPAGDQAAVDRWLGLTSQEEALFGDLIEAVKGSDDARMQEIGAHAQRLERRAERIAHGIGMRSSCSGD